MSYVVRQGSLYRSPKAKTEEPQPIDIDACAREASKAYSVSCANRDTQPWRAVAAAVLKAAGVAVG